MPSPPLFESGISQESRKAITAGLSHLLANTYTLYLKTHNFHWNVVGPQFNTLHHMFETQYTELAMAVDVIAERIRALGEFAPGSYSAYKELSSVQEAPGSPPKAEEMIRQLAEDQLIVVSAVRKLFPLVGDASDEATADLLTHRMDIHEKTAWMLRSLLS